MSEKPIAIVTGGAGGIGEACVRRIARDFRVVVTDTNLPAAQKIADSISGVAIEADIASERSVADCVTIAEREVGPLDALIMCAGIIQERAFAPEEFEQSDWDQIQTVNTRGTWLVCKEVGTRMARRGRGSIVTVASVAGLRSFPTHSYAASKAAVLSLTRGLAVEWGRSGVRVNSISPGFTLTPRLKELIEVRNWDAGAIGNQTALGRWIDPEEIADAAAFLISDQARAITGIDLPVDAGWLCSINWLSFNGVPPSRDPVTA